MKLILAAATATLALTGAAQAQGRPSTTAMTCGQAASIVAQRGSVVLATGRDLYDRYVRNQFMCETGLQGRAAFVPTLDNPQCNIGFYCTSMPPFYRR